MIDIYESNPHPFLLPRPATDFRRAVARGQHFVVEQHGQIVAASGVFDYTDDRPFVELSETLVLPPLRRRGLQGLFFRLRIASVVVTQGPSIGITTAIDPRNEVSLTSAHSQGFQLWPSVIPEAYASCSTCRNQEAASKMGRPCCCDFYCLPIEQARARVRALLAETTLLDEFTEGPVDLHGKAGSLSVDCSGCRVVADHDYRAMLRDFADGASW